MEEINRAGGNSGASTVRCTTWYAPASRFGGAETPRTCRASHTRAAVAIDGGHEPSTGTDTTSLKTTAVKQGVAIRNGQKVMDLAHSALGLMILLARHDAACASREKGRRPVDIPRRFA